MSVRRLMLGALMMVAATAGHADTAWKNFTVKAGGFSVSMPTQPKQESYTFKAGQENATAYRWVSGQGRQTYVAAYVPVPARYHSGLRVHLAKSLESPEIKNLMLLMANSVAQRMGAKVDATASGVFRDMPCLSALSRVEGAIVRTTCMISPERMYLLLSVTPSGQEDSPAVRKFLGSFKRA